MEELGLANELLFGAADGDADRLPLGEADGDAEAVAVGGTDGNEEGRSVGEAVGCVETDGNCVGEGEYGDIVQVPHSMRHEQGQELTISQTYENGEVPPKRSIRESGEATQSKVTPRLSALTCNFVKPIVSNMVQSRLL